MFRTRKPFTALMVAALSLIVAISSQKPAQCAGEKIVVYSAGPGGLAKAIQAGFEAKTGIQVEMFQSTTGKILGRLEAEKSNPLADVVVLASWPSAEGLRQAGMTQAYPGVKNGNKVYTTWREKSGHYFAYSASALGVAYNTMLVKKAPRDWSDFVKPEWKGKVNIPDPGLSGSCLDFISGYANAKGQKAWNFFAELKANAAMVNGANTEALNMVITGSRSAVLAGVDYMTYSAKAKGEPVDLFYPKSGTVISPRPAMIMKSSKHVENARLFMDYLLSDDAQKMVVDALLLPGRKDVRSDKRPNVAEIKVLKYNLNWMAEHNESNLERFNSIF
jgi:iron(III) transport system substrate-binding protein